MKTATAMRGSRRRERAPDVAWWVVGEPLREPWVQGQEERQ